MSNDKFFDVRANIPENISQEELAAIALAVQKVNNDIREYFGQEPNSTEVSNNVIRQVIEEGFLHPPTQHARWREARLAEGWRYGEVYDEANKVHPNLHPDGYDALPFSERIKDFAFWSVIRGISVFRIAHEHLRATHRGFIPRGDSQGTPIPDDYKGEV